MAQTPNGSQPIKKPGRQRANDFASGGDLDNSMFFFGDLNMCGAFPTTPAVYQKPRSQVFLRDAELVRAAGVHAMESSL